MIPITSTIPSYQTLDQQSKGWYDCVGRLYIKRFAPSGCWNPELSLGGTLEGFSHYVDLNRVGKTLDERCQSST